MKIARINQFFPRKQVRLVKITTNNGLVRWGETPLEGKPKSTVAAVEKSPTTSSERTRCASNTTGSTSTARPSSGVVRY